MTNVYLSKGDRSARTKNVETSENGRKRSGSPTQGLIKTLTKNQVTVTEDTILLINAAEVLARDGIHGKIASVGVGFGTGRHTQSRRLGSPEKGTYKKSNSLSK